MLRREDSQHHLRNREPSILSWLPPDVARALKVKFSKLALYGLCAAIFCGCITDAVGLGHGQRVWVAIEPVQCLRNSWEQDWLVKHDQNYSGYPRGREGEFAVIKAYFEGMGVTVHALASRPKYAIVCMACFCPRGDTLYLLVNAQDVLWMTEMGFRREAPRGSGSITWYGRDGWSL